MRAGLPWQGRHARQASRRAKRRQAAALPDGGCEWKIGASVEVRIAGSDRAKGDGVGDLGWRVCVLGFWFQASGLIRAGLPWQGRHARQASRHARRRQAAALQDGGWARKIGASVEVRIAGSDGAKGDGVGDLGWRVCVLGFWLQASGLIREVLPWQGRHARQASRQAKRRQAAALQDGGWAWKIGASVEVRIAGSDEAKGDGDTVLVPLLRWAVTWDATECEFDME